MIVETILFLGLSWMIGFYGSIGYNVLKNSNISRYVYIGLSTFLACIGYSYYFHTLEFWSLILTICLGYISIIISSRYSVIFDKELFIEYIIGYLNFHYNYSTDKYFIFNFCGIAQNNQSNRALCDSIERNCVNNSYFIPEKSTRKELLVELLMLDFFGRLKCVSDKNKCVKDICEEIVLKYVVFHGKKGNEYKNFREFDQQRMKYMLDGNCMKRTPSESFNKFGKIRYNKIVQDCHHLLQQRCLYLYDPTNYEFHIRHQDEYDNCSDDEIDFWSWFNKEYKKLGTAIDKKVLIEKMMNVGLIVKKN